MEPVPTWARVAGVLTAVLATPLLVVLVIGGTVTASLTTASVHRTLSFTVGAVPHLTLDGQLGTLLLETGAPGLISIDDRHSAGSITRAAAGAAVGRMRLEASQQGDDVRVRETSPLYEVSTTQRNAVLTVRVPPHTDLDLSTLGDVEIDRVDGRIHIGGVAGTATLRDVTLRGSSTIDDAVGDVRLERATVAGTVSVHCRVGSVDFDGLLAPGGSSLSVVDGTGDVSITLPRPTDARATVATQVGDLNADPAWHFTPDQLGAPHRWSADLGPNPTGSVTVGTTLGSVHFRVR
jgi:hypothetical protein